MDFVEISELVTDTEYGMQLEYLVEPKAQQEHVSEIHVHKLGLLLTGVEVTVHPTRIQVFGKTENIYIGHLELSRRQEIARSLLDKKVRCIVIARNMEAPREFIDPLVDAGVCLLITPLKSDEFIRRATNFLTDKLAARVSVHGVLVDILGVGLLLIGKGGIGKSECALDLVHRGHRLVADDLVELVKWHEVIVGHCSILIRHHMEIRGLGIINIQDLYGIGAVRDRKRVDLVIELVKWSPDLKLDPLGIEDAQYEILGIELPHIKLPVLPGKNLSMLVEVAARNHLLKMGGHDSAKEFQKRLGRETAALERAPLHAGEDVE